MKKLFAALLALVLALGLAGCGQKKTDTDDAAGDGDIPETPVKLETLHVEFVKGGRDTDDLLALRDALPLVPALGAQNVEIGSAAVTFGTSADATAQALAEGSVDVAFLPLTSSARFTTSPTARALPCSRPTGWNTRCAPTRRGSSPSTA